MACRILRPWILSSLSSLFSSPRLFCALAPIKLLAQRYWGTGRCLLRWDTPIIVGKNPKPAAAVLSCFFERNNIHLPPGVANLYLGKPVCCPAFFDEGCRYRPIRQNILQEYFWIFSPARGPFHDPFSWRRPPLSQPLKDVRHYCRPLICSLQLPRSHPWYRCCLDWYRRG
jgi:hypothetical protein